jgi:hypothetical protein
MKKAFYTTNRKKTQKGRPAVRFILNLNSLGTIEQSNNYRLGRRACPRQHLKVANPKGELG